MTRNYSNNSFSRLPYIVGGMVFLGTALFVYTKHFIPSFDKEANLVLRHVDLEGIKEIQEEIRKQQLLKR